MIKLMISMYCATMLQALPMPSGVASTMLPKPTAAPVLVETQDHHAQHTV